MSKAPIAALQQLVIPNFQEFGDFLHDRIHAQLQHQQFFRDSFTIFLILRDRQSPERFANKLVYAGVQRQRDFFDLRQVGISNKLEEVWSKMRKATLNRSTLPITTRLMQEYDGNTMSMKKLIRFDKIQDHYFKVPRAKWENTREWEYRIMETCFPTTDNLYMLGLPIFLFGNLEGMAQVVFTEVDIDQGREEDLVEDKYRYFIERWRPVLIAQIIKLISREYEDLVWNWLLPLEGKKAVSFKTWREFNQAKEHLFDNALETIRAKNKHILRDLKFEEYYQYAAKYYERRKKDQAAHINVYLKQNRRHAVTKILVDSFSHNVSAHSLTVLKWIFQQRWETISEKLTPRQLRELEEVIEPVAKMLDIDVDSTKRSVKALFKKIRTQKRLIEQSHTSVLPIRDQIGSINRELTFFFRYLAEKGAFWNGVGRGEQFGGEIRNLYELLYEGFARNPLFLGTIAYAEGVRKINVKVRLFAQRDSSFRRQADKDLLKRTYQYATDQTGTLLKGTLAIVDTSEQDDFTYRQTLHKKGAEHDLLKKALEQVEVFLPGGVVGRHAFFTLLENTLRDVKHLPEVALKDIAVNGLDLVVSVFPSKLSRAVRKVSNDYSLYKVGIHLNSLQSATQKQPLAARALENINKDILTSTSAARLGGSQQDKLCAAMLLTGNFNDFDYEDDPLVASYAPWLRFSQAYDVDHTDSELAEYEFRVDWQNNLQSGAALANIPASDFVFKKYFHLWRGEFVSFLDSTPDNLAYNMRRFRIVAVANEATRNAVRAREVVRVIITDRNDLSSEEAYGQWLQHWVGDRKERLELQIGQGETAVYLVRQGESILHYNIEDYSSAVMEQPSLSILTKRCFQFEHSETSSSGKLRLRNHGMLRTHFFPDIADLAQLPEAKLKNPRHAYELFETLTTRICVFDDRIAQRLNPVERE
ncbi:MAG: hypothetical protein AAF734_01965, partial [Bacteroidota bacterium]